MKYLDLIDAAVPNWHEHAACRRPGNDPAWWFSSDPSETNMALDICNNHCPVREQCLSWALDLGDQHGIFGGRSLHARRRMLEKRNAA